MALEGHDIPAQGNALGYRVLTIISPERASYSMERPYRALFCDFSISQGVALGWYIMPLWGNLLKKSHEKLV